MCVVRFYRHGAPPALEREFLNSRLVGINRGGVKNVRSLPAARRVAACLGLCPQARDGLRRPSLGAPLTVRLAILRSFRPDARLGQSG